MPVAPIPQAFWPWLVTTSLAQHELLLSLHAEDPAHIEAYAHNLGLTPDPHAGHHDEIRLARTVDGTRFLVWAPGPASH
ncbi:hypothetical protein [Phytomonospora endophytica]|uniref:Uncharacterized protein n=1 Tax=Phytomonospora endophytica TaxID=714109 RepID=A0A841FRZ7_9ACTN|nr:hypothetical protein [Phytomonospora endophytica]MBB6038574.1 hypothetical protein [Phytomonospora endophytica]GIG69284.1 hypothetical protein Pen01_55790 [Phytomonospora endophytica]